MNFRSFLSINYFNRLYFQMYVFHFWTTDLKWLFFTYDFPGDSMILWGSAVTGPDSWAEWPQICGGYVILLKPKWGAPWGTPNNESFIAVPNFRKLTGRIDTDHSKFCGIVYQCICATTWPCMGPFRPYGLFHGPTNGQNSLLIYRLTGVTVLRTSCWEQSLHG